MRSRCDGFRLLFAGASIAAAWTVGVAAATAAALPPGRPHVLTIKGNSTVTFVPETGMDPLPIDYKASIEYLVNPRDLTTVAKDEAKSKTKAARRSTRAADRRRRAEADDDRPKAAGVVEIALHSAEITLRQRQQVVVQTRIRRSRFEGRLLPDAPILTVTYNESPPALRALLDRFDTAAAALALDQQGRVIDRRTRFDGPLHPVVETLMAIHTPIPSDADAWNVPAQLAMGYGQSAQGTLRFEKVKASPDTAVAASSGTAPNNAPIKVKVTGALKAEGAIVGNLIKGGTYKVTGEQVYDPATRDWQSARWTVEIETELAAQGATIAHAKGKMIVESRALESPSAGRDPQLPGRRPNERTTSGDIGPAPRP